MNSIYGSVNTGCMRQARGVPGIMVIAQSHEMFIDSNKVVPLGQWTGLVHAGWGQNTGIT